MPFCYLSILIDTFHTFTAILTSLRWLRSFSPTFGPVILWMTPQVPEGWLEIDKHYSLELCFFYWKTTWDCLARGVFSIGYRGFRHLDTLLDGSNDFDETLIEYGPGLHLPGGMGNYPRKIQLEKAQRKNVLSMLKPIGFFGRSFNWTFLKIRSNDLLHFSL